MNGAVNRHSSVCEIEFAQQRPPDTRRDLCIHALVTSLILKKQERNEKERVKKKIKNNEFGRLRVNSMFCHITLWVLFCCGRTKKKKLQKRGGEEKSARHRGRNSFINTV